jgi:hypothetical protein
VSDRGVKHLCLVLFGERSRGVASITAPATPAQLAGRSQDELFRNGEAQRHLNPEWSFTTQAHDEVSGFLNAERATRRLNDDPTAVRPMPATSVYKVR